MALATVLSCNVYACFRKFQFFLEPFVGKPSGFFVEELNKHPCYSAFLRCNMRIRYAESYGFTGDRFFCGIQIVEQKRVHAVLVCGEVFCLSGVITDESAVVIH